MSVQIASYLNHTFHSIPSAYQATSSVSFPCLPVPVPSSSQYTSSVPVRQRTASKAPAKPTKSDKLPEVVASAPPADKLRHYAFNPSPISDVDNQAYENLVRFEDEILACGYSSDKELAVLAERYAALQEELEPLLDGGCLGEHTLELWVEVLDQAEDILADAIESEETLLLAEKDVAVAVKAVMEQAQREEPSAQPESLGQQLAVEQPPAKQLTVAVAPSQPRPSKSKAPKVPKAWLPIASSSSAPSSSTPRSRPPSPSAPAPAFKQKPEPDEDTKTFRKRKIDVAMPGKEAAKYMPLRVFFAKNVFNPYPSAKAKYDLATAAGIDESSVSQWFTNARRRSGWGAVMKKFANNDKKDMEALMRSTFGPAADPSFVMSTELQAAIDGMRTYTEKLTEDVVGDKFNDLLEISKARTREEKLQLYEDDRKARVQPRKRAPVIKEEPVDDVDLEAPVGKKRKPVEEVDIDAPPVGKKRKRKVESEEPNIGQRSVWSVQPSLPTEHVQGTQSKFPVVPVVKAEPIVPSLESRPPPAKKARVARKKQEKAPPPPKDLHRRRGGVADVRAPQLSACPTLLEIDAKHTPSPVGSKGSVASSSSSSTLVSCPSLPVSPVESSQQVNLSVPSSHVAAAQAQLAFESRQRSRSATVVSQGLSRHSSVTHYAPTLPTPCDSFAQSYPANGTGEVMWDTLADVRRGQPSRSSPSPSPEQATAEPVQPQNMDQHIQAWDTMRPEEWRVSGKDVQVYNGSGLPTAVQQENSYIQWGETQPLLSYAPIQEQQQQQVLNAFAPQQYSYAQEIQPLPSYASYQSITTAQSFQQYDSLPTHVAEPLPPSYDEFMGTHPSQSASDPISWISMPQSLAMDVPQPAPAYSTGPSPMYQSSMVNPMGFVIPAPSYAPAFAGTMKLPEVSINWGPQLGLGKNHYPQEMYATALSTLQQGF